MNDHSSSCCGNCHAHGKGKALSHWVRLRFSAVLALPFIAWVVYSVVSLKGADHMAFTAWLSLPLNASLFAVFVIISCYHAALGVQEIIEDYISCEKSQKCWIMLEKIGFLAIAATCLYSIVTIAV